MMEEARVSISILSTIKHLFKKIGPIILLLCLGHYLKAMEDNRPQSNSVLQNHASTHCLNQLPALREHSLLSADEWKLHAHALNTSRRALRQDLAECAHALGFITPPHVFGGQNQLVESLITITSELLIPITSSNELDSSSLRGLINEFYLKAYQFAFYPVRLLQDFMVLMITFQDTKERTQCLEYHIALSEEYQNTIAPLLDRIVAQAPGVQAQAFFPESFLGRSGLITTDTRYDIDSSYISPITTVAHVLSVENIIKDRSAVIRALIAFREDLEYKHHFQTIIKPLVSIKHAINAILPCLHFDTLTSREQEYVHLHLACLGMLVQRHIPYDLKGKIKQSVIEGFEATIRNKHAHRDEKHYAKRMLLHHGLGLPWQDLLYLAMAIRNKSVQLTLTNVHSIARDLALIKQSINTLLSFEIYEYLTPGHSLTTNHVTTALSTITQWGGCSRDTLNLCKAKTVLEKSLAHKQAFDTLTGRYALMRILEIVGELGKNLSLDLQNTAPAFWQQMGKLRNCLSHLKRKGAHLRLPLLICDDIQGILKQIAKDFEALYQYISILLESLSLPQDLPKPTLEMLPGVRSLLEELDLSITTQERDLLRDTLSLSALEERNENVTAILDCLQSSKPAVDGDFEQKLAKLGHLSGKQKKALKQAYKNRSTVPITLENPLIAIIKSQTLSKEELAKEIDALIHNVSSYTSWQSLEKKLTEYPLNTTEPWKHTFERTRPKISKKTVGQKSELLIHLNRSLQAIRGITKNLLALSTISQEIVSINAIDPLIFLLKNNPHLELACQYLVSCLRDDASTIEVSAKFLTNYEYYFDSERFKSNYIICHLQNDLLNLILKGNALLHNHDTVEMGTLTDSGHALTLSNLVKYLLAEGQFSFQENLEAYQGYLTGYVANHDNGTQSLQSSTPINAPNDSVYGATLDDDTLYFREHALPKDHDCGFHGLGISRQRAVAQLLNAKSDMQIRQFVAQDIQEALRSGTLPETCTSDELKKHFQYLWDFGQLRDGSVRSINDSLGLKGAERMDAQNLAAYKNKDNLSSELQRMLAELNSHVIQLGLQERWIQNYCMRRSIYEEFIKQYLNRDEWLSYVLHGRGVLDALAHLNDLSVYVWVKESADPSHLRLNHHSLIAPSGNEIHLLHRDGATHFNFLERTSHPILIDPPLDTENRTATSHGDEDLIGSLLYYAAGFLS